MAPEQRDRGRMQSWIRNLFRRLCHRYSPKTKELPPLVPVSKPTLDPARRVVRVWIDEGCLICNACESTCPSVFVVREYHASVRTGATDFFTTQRDLIEEAQDGCCVDIIKIAYADGYAPPGPQVTSAHRL